jgi:lincosamide nucleotidyltransferase A/C/D/E
VDIQRRAHRRAPPSLCREPLDAVPSLTATAWNFLMRNATGAVVDLHAIVLDANGDGVLGPPEAGHAYPAESLTGRGKIADQIVDCITAAWAVKFRDAYTGHADDRADVLALCRRFELPVPYQYQS